MIATAGKRLSESDLRQAVQCLERLHFGDTYTWSTEMWASKYLVEKVLAHRIRKGDHRLDFWTMKYLSQAMSQTDAYLTDDITDSKEARDVIMFHHEVTQKMSGYIPLWPPDVIELIISKTPVEVNISGIYKDPKYQTLHILDITPYVSRFDMKNDPTTVIKAAALKDFVKKHHTGRPQLIIHQFGRNRANMIAYKTFTNMVVTPQQLERVTNVVKTLEAGIHFPAVPCPDHKCPFRTVCFPSED